MKRVAGTFGSLTLKALPELKKRGPRLGRARRARPDSCTGMSAMSIGLRLARRRLSWTSSLLSDQSSGRRRCLSVTPWKAWAARQSSASAKGLAASWKPIGMPSALAPQGTVMVG